MFRLVKVILFVSLAVCGVQSMKEVDNEVMTKIHNFQLCANCWGEDFAMQYMKSIMAACEKCGGNVSPAAKSAAAAGLMAFPSTVLRGVYPLMPQYTGYYSPYTNLGRKKREINPADWAVGPTEAYAFMDQMESMVGNFTCVMKELSLLTPSGDINTEVFASKVSGWGSGNKAGADPVFLNKLTSEMRDCATISRTWPQQSLNKNPFMQKYGRMAIYFHCIKKAERQCCAKYVLADHFEKCGIPINIPAAADKYDAAAMAAKIMKASATPEMKHLDDYFWGDMEM